MRSRVDNDTLERYLKKVPASAANKALDYLSKVEPIEQELNTPLGLSLLEEIDRRRQEYASKVLNGGKTPDDEMLDCPHCDRKINVNKLYYQCWDKLFDKIIATIRQLNKVNQTINEVAKD